MPAAPPHGAMPILQIDGSPLPDWATTLVEQTVLDTHVHLPDVLQLRLRDESNDVLKRLNLQLGSRIQLSATSMDGSAPKPIAVAEVTSFEHDHGPGGSHAIVHAWDLSHRMSRGRHTKTWHDITDSAIVTELGSKAGIPLGEIEASSVVQQQVSQINSTDWDFLRARAAETGYEIALVLGKLTWRTPTRSADGPSKGDLTATGESTKLVVGSTLKRFHPRLTSSGQVKDVEVRGWDPAAKKALSSRKPTASLGGAVALSLTDVTGKIGGDVHVSVDNALQTQAEVENAATALADAVGSAHIEADGVAVGNPQLVAGTAVSVGLAGWPYDGTYTLTTARHVYDRSGYHTHFTASGRQERSLLGLATMGATKGASRASGAPIDGVVIGIVSDVRDPLGWGRVRLQLPWLDDGFVTPWARIAMPGAGPGRGTIALPEVGDEVLVAFDHGDTRVPYVVGMLWNGQDAPPLAAGVDPTTGQVKDRGFVSRKGHSVVFHEDDGIEVYPGGKAVTVQLTTGGAVTIKANGDITVSAEGAVTISSGGDMAIKASGALKLEGSGVTVSSNGSLSMSGTTATLDGGGSTTIKGGTIALN